MSTSTDGILAYGYDLGGGDSEFELASGDGYLPDWYDETNEDQGFDEQAIDQLLAAAALAGIVEDGDLYADQTAAQARLGIQIVAHCSGEYPMWLLAARVITAYRGSPKAVDLSLPDGADERLSWALGVLGIKPKAEQPAWLLASYWG